MHMEHIVSFGERFSQNRPFHIAITGITYPSPNYHITRKNSDIYSLEYIIGGEGTVQVGKQFYYPCKGDVYILPKGQYHDYFSAPQNPFHKIWMCVNGPLCDELIHLYGLAGVVLVKQMDACSMFEEFLGICENKELSLDEIYVRCTLIFHRLLMKIAEHLSMEKRKRGAADEIKAYIDRNIFERLSIGEISSQLNISPSQINRIFKKAFETTPYDYILARKISMAKLFLKNTDLTVKEIAYRLNFADEHYFSNLFLKKTGQRPGKYGG